MRGNALLRSTEHHLLSAVRRLGGTAAAPEGPVVRFVESWQFHQRPGQDIEVAWSWPQPGSAPVGARATRLYVRGDTQVQAQRQQSQGLLGADKVQLANDAHYDGVVRELFRQAGVALPQAAAQGRLQQEEAFHDQWAQSAQLDGLDVRKAAEACTSPELRFIRSQLGELQGRTLLDVGSGLGEASVYFALEGARVTSMDLAAGMLKAAEGLAARHGVSLETVQSAAEDVRLPADRKFDIIYAGNLLHHVDIEAALAGLAPHLKPDGVFVSWDPMKYNPVINVYRRLATDVRTPTEHPLGVDDVKSFEKYFAKVETRYFWLSTLAIFLVMAVWQRRNPNRERFWKVIVDEADRWAWLYRPLEALDDQLLERFPRLGPLCWNTVIMARQPKVKDEHR